MADLKQGNEAEQNICTVISFELLKRSSGLNNIADMKYETKSMLRFLALNVVDSPAADSAVMKVNASEGLHLSNIELLYTI
jgi:hypothetical protein